MKRPWYVYALAAAIVFAALVTVAWLVQTTRLHAEQRAHAQAALATANAIAKGDTTREVYRDSLRIVVERLVLQQPQQSDAIAKLLHAQRIALDSIRASVRALNVRAVPSTTPVSVDESGARRGTFDVRDPPYTAHADVTLPARGLGSIDLSVRLDTLALGLRLLCRTANADGIRVATATVSAPPWATIALASVTQDEGLCRSPALEATAPTRDTRLRIAFVAGYGYTLGGVSARSLPSSGEWRAFVGLAIAKPIALPRWLPLHERAR